jgi:predicted RNA methylase
MGNSNSSKGGIFKGNSHADGGIKFTVPETGQGIEVEGEEPLIPREALTDTTPKTRKGTNKKILHDINKNVGAKGMDEKATEVHAGDSIVCKKAVGDNTIKEVSGSDRQIVSAINQEAGCNEIESGGSITKNGKTTKFKLGGKTAKEEKILEARWEKKKSALEHLSNNIRRLRHNITTDLSSDNEKKQLTALVVGVMDKTAERVGNETSKENGHLGITGLQKKNVTVLGNAIHLKYTGKSGVKHQYSFSDKRISKALKRAIKNTPNNDIFTTTEGFKIKADRINRYLDKFGITAKDLRGYSANKWMVEKLKNVTPEETEYKRKRQFNKVLKSVAEKVGHGGATLRKHYLLPEIPEKFVLESKVVDLKSFYREGGDVPKKEILTKPHKKTTKVKKGGLIAPNGKKSNLNIVEDKGSVSYVVIKPTQIKLADGSNTTFNVSNPDIRYESGGDIAKRLCSELFNKGGNVNLANEAEIKQKLRYLAKILHLKSKHSDTAQSVEDSFVNQVKQMMQDGRYFSSKTATDQLAIKEYGIEDKRFIKELTELAIVEFAREIAHLYSGKDAYDKLVEFYKRQPFSTQRTTQTIALAQYSTPVPLSYAMGEYVLHDNHNSESVYFEPSAGNGMLTVAFNPSQVVANEIDKERLNVLRKQGFKEVLYQNANLHFDFGDTKFDGVIANPPFGGAKSNLVMNRYILKGLEQQIIARSLEYMKDNGRAAFIIGGHSEYDESGMLTNKKDVVFLNYLAHTYHLEDVININGELYSRQGTKYPIRIILVNGRKDEPSGNFIIVKDNGVLKPFAQQPLNTFDDIWNRINLHIE